MTASTRVDEFEELRPHLLAVAYRLTGTVADAEDLVQDAWIRWDGSDAHSIRDLRAWLTTVVSRLSPDRRVAFVLHDGFAVPFAEIAEVLGVSVAAARQLASRARRTVAEAPPPVSDDVHNEVAGLLMAALAAGDMDAVVRLLHPDVTFT